jgi:ABC-type ATPase involved in cell division
MYLSLVNDLLNVNIDTNEKYTFIQGFSGAGKSLFVQEVEASIEIEDDTLKTSNKCYVISNP